MDPPAECAPNDSASGSGRVPPDMGNNAWDSYDTVFLNAKAGMDGVDKKKVQKVVYEMSKGSRYFNNEQRKEAEVLQRVQRMNSRVASLTPADLAEQEKATDLKIAELEASRDLSRIWVHVDMDAFYAAVETLVNPSLAGKPMAVGGMSMICTANYEARKFGVRAAMPGFIARKLCRDLIFVRPDFKKYSHYSELSRQVFQEYDTNFVARSMDEAYLDITKSCQLRNISAEEVVEEIRNKVNSATGLTCSAGVGPNRLLAKVCSDINKPNGQFVLRNERGAVMAFVSSLPIRKVCGIGKVTERLLKEVLEISTCADLLRKKSLISSLFSQTSTDFFLAVGLGIGGSETPEKEQRKSLSNERTFPAISDERQLFKKLEELVELLADDMLNEDLQGRTLTLKLKETGFEVRSRGVTLPAFIHTKAEIWEHSSKLLKAELPLSLRLMGLRISNFKGEKPEPTDPSQRTLTSFITQFGASGSRCGHVSKGLSKIPLDPSANALDRAAETCKGIGVPQLSSDLISTQAHFTTLTQRDHGTISEPTHMSTDAGLGSSPRQDMCLLENFQCSSTADMEKIFSSSTGRSCQSPRRELPTNMSGGVKVVHIKEYEEEVLDPESIEEFVDPPPESFEQRISAGFQSESGNGREARQAIGFHTAEPNWETLQSGYDSIHDQIWVNDNQCALCGIEVNDCLPSVRQEHEDYHFALWIQQQAEGFQRSTTPTKKGTRPTEREASKRKAVSGGKVNRTPQKRSSHLPLEAFFSKAK